ncbi:hypothetical protein RMSM_03957, partial [Rhodopirellula maiorica SM1]
AGGRVHFKYQRPAFAIYPDNGTTRPHSILIPQILLERFGNAAPPSQSFTEFIIGSDAERRVVAVELALEQIDSGLISHLESLPDLDTLFVEMPGKIVHRDSEEMLRLTNLKSQLSVNIQEAFQPKKVR